MPQNVEFELSSQVEGNVEASQLLEQIESLRGAVRFLRRENGYLKGQEMLKEIQSLPSLGSPGMAYDGPSLPTLSTDIDEDGGVDDDPSTVQTSRRKSTAMHGKKSTAEVDEEPLTGARKEGKASLQSLSRDSKLLYRELLEYSASPKLVDLEALEKERKVGWMPHKKTAAYELWERKREGDRLRKQVKGLRLQTARLVSIGG
jgi:dynactin 1